MSVEQGLKARLIRTFGFVRKELFTILRQPRLILTLVIGPFLILLIFGIGYRQTPPPFQTLLVLENEEARLAADREDLSQSFGDSIDLVGTVTDQEAAESRLREGEVDLVVVAPGDPAESLDEGEAAVFTVVHAEVDPVLRRSIGLLAKLSIDEINRRVLAQMVDQAQESSEELDDPLPDLEEHARGLVAAIESGDESAATERREALEEGLAAAEGRGDRASALYSSVAEILGTSDEHVYSTLGERLEATDSSDRSEALDSARTIETALGELQTELDRAQRLDPGLLVAPFGAEVKRINRLPDAPAFFYAPGVLVLLVQHLAVTFAAMSLVRERELGITEVFRASPLSVSEALAGKYLAFLAISGTVAAVLAGTILAFGIEIRGPAWMFVVTLVLMILASLGVGFLISGLAKTDSQAVQYSMIVLLVSIFFTGFILPLDQLIAPVRSVSYLIPGTYGIAALHDTMFRGVAADPVIVGGLTLYTVVMAAVAWFAIRRDVVSTGT